MLGPDTPDEFPEFNGWRPKVLRSEIETFDLKDAEILLLGDSSGHGAHASGLDPSKSQFWAGASEQDVVDGVNWVIDRPSDGYPLRDGGFTLFDAHPKAVGAVWVRYHGRWVIVTGHPIDYNECVRIHELGMRLWQAHSEHLPEDIRRETLLHAKYRAWSAVAMNVVQYATSSLSSAERDEVREVLDHGDFRKSTEFFRDLISA